jgi:hypothetical protein
MHVGRQAARIAYATSPRSPQLGPAKLLSAAPLLCRVWDSLRSATRAKSMVLFYKGRCLMHVGYAASGPPVGGAAPGPICQQAMKSGTGNYLANLVLFPGEWGAWLGLPASLPAAPDRHVYTVASQPAI